MKYQISFFLFLLSFSSFSQTGQKDIVSNTKLDEEAIYSILNLAEIDFHRFELSQKFKEFFCDFVIIEYKDGRQVDSVSLEKSLDSYKTMLLVGNSLEKNIFPISVYSQKIADSTLKLRASVGSVGLKRKLKLYPDRPYSWKSVYDLSENKHVLKPGDFYPLLAYTTAVGKKFATNSDADEFCKVSGEVIPFTDWYSELGITHYFVMGIYLKK